MGEWEELRNLLVIDDNPADERFIEEALDQSEINPTLHSVTTSREALDFLSQQPPFQDVQRPDLVLLDWHLAETTGEEVLAALERDHANVSVIVMTDSHTKQRAADTAMAGADAVIEKPTDPHEYIDSIRAILDS